MGCAKGVVDVDVAQGGQLAHEGEVVALLALVEAQVLEHHHLAVLEGKGCGEGLLAGDGAAHQGDRLAQQLDEAHGRGHHGELAFEHAACGAAEVACDDHAGLVLDQVAQSGQGLADAGVIHHDALVQGDVEVDPHQHALAGNVHILDGLLVLHVASSSFKGDTAKHSKDSPPEAVARVLNANGGALAVTPVVLQAAMRCERAVLWSATPPWRPRPRRRSCRLQSQRRHWHWRWRPLRWRPLRWRPGSAGRS